MSTECCFFSWNLRVDVLSFSLITNYHTNVLCIHVFVVQLSLLCGIN